MPASNSTTVWSTGSPTSASATRRVGVSRLSIGFRHLMDWGRESQTQGSGLTDQRNVTPFTRSNSHLNMMLAGNIPGASKSQATVAGSSSGTATMPGGGMPRAENAVFGYLDQELPEAQQSPQWFDNYVRQMEYIIAEQEISGENANPAIPTRRWIYGIPSRPQGGSVIGTHSTGGDARTPHLAGLIRNSAQERISNIYGLFYAHLAGGGGQMSAHRLQQVLKFLQGRDPDLWEMGKSMAQGIAGDTFIDSDVETRVAESTRAARTGVDDAGTFSGASRQEILSELGGTSSVIDIGHASLGGANPIDVIFNQPLQPPLPPMRLADITEEDWTDGGHHGTGTGTGGLTTAPAIITYYNSNRIPQYNRIINLVREFTRAYGGGTQPFASSNAAGESEDAWYRRRATQIATSFVGWTGDDPSTSMIEGRRASAREGQSRGTLEDTFQMLYLGIQEQETWAQAAGFTTSNAIDDLTFEDLKFVLHHMGTSGYDFLQEDPNFEQNQYGELIAFDRGQPGNPDYWTVAINFQVNNDGTFANLDRGDVAVVQQSIQDIFLQAWRGNLTDAQLDEAKDLAVTASSLGEFTSYLTQTAATAALGRYVSFVARADAAIPAQMDTLMYTFFNLGTADMQLQMQDMLSNIRAEADRYSNTLRSTLSQQLQPQWPTYAWGSRARGETPFGPWGGGQHYSDTSHSRGNYPPTGLSMQNHFGIDFGNRRFWPQFGDDKSLWPKQTDEQYEAEHGFSVGATTAERAAAGHVGKSPNRKRERLPDMTNATNYPIDFVEEDERENGVTNIPWYRGVNDGVWSPGGQDLQPGPPDPLEFVWAAPYVVWQHYQRSGSA